MPIQLAEPKPMPGVANPSTLDKLTSNYWTMHYKHGPTPHCQKNFYLTGTLREAIARAHDHCQVMNYRLIMVQPMVADLEHEEHGRVL